MLWFGLGWSGLGVWSDSDAKKGQKMVGGVGGDDGRLVSPVRQLRFHPVVFVVVRVFEDVAEQYLVAID